MSLYVEACWTARDSASLSPLVRVYNQGRSTMGI